MGIFSEFFYAIFLLTMIIVLVSEFARKPTSRRFNSSATVNSSDGYYFQQGIYQSERFSTLYFRNPREKLDVVSRAMGGSVDSAASGFLFNQHNAAEAQLKSMNNGFDTEI